MAVDSKSCKSPNSSSVFASLAMFVWLLISFALACVDSTFKVADETLARTSAKKGVQVFSSKPHFQYSVASSSMLFSLILFMDSIPPLASLFTTWLEFSTKLDDKIFSYILR